jgi:protein TonB
MSEGVLKGNAISLPKPIYPPIARQIGLQGLVTVQILIDEEGRVVSAKAISGHPLLNHEAEKAAMQARFTPTKLSNQPVKVSGVISYNFVKQ